MQIISYDIRKKNDLINYLKHNTVLFSNPDIQPYLDAKISVCSVRQDDLLPTQTYVYFEQLNVMRELDEYFGSNGIDFVSQEGFITYRTFESEYTLMPPIVELVNGRPLLIDGMHRVTYVGRKDKNRPFKAVIVSGVSKDLKPSVLSLPDGWSNISEFGPGGAPDGFVKRFKRYGDDKAYKYYFRKYQFPGNVKIVRSGTSIDFDLAIPRVGGVRNLNYECERKWILPKFVLQRNHSYLIKSENIVQGYLPSGPQLSLVGDDLFVVGKQMLRLDSEDAAGVRDGILDVAGNFPDDAEFRYRFRGGRYLATFKSETANMGRDRSQVEFDIKIPDFNRLRQLTEKEIRKTRALVPDGKGAIEIDFYERPDLSFVSIEREFLKSEDPAAYVLPNWLARLHPIDVTSDKAFKNKNLTRMSGDGHLAANVRFDEIMRTVGR
ncbi:MAG: hypothetical protein LBT45_02835 [Rickettsiales bacterium]|jgi:hypothetical protein|nr:hypothetical protein [Rickettsiales bacterium]